MNTFLKDKEFSEKYEKHFAEKLGYTWKEHKGNDHGIDIFKGDDKLDVKTYRKPLNGQYKGFFIETYLPLSCSPGWYCDETKECTGYILVKDAERTGKVIEYDHAWKITKHKLMRAIEEAQKDHGELVIKKTDSGWGFILPYGYVAAYGEEV